MHDSGDNGTDEDPSFVLIRTHPNITPRENTEAYPSTVMGKGHGCHTHPRGQTAAVYQENRYWQSAVSWLNSGIPSFTRGSQWKKMVEETDLVLSFPHLEDEANTTSRSPSVTRERRPQHHYHSPSGHCKCPTCTLSPQV